MMYPLVRDLAADGIPVAVTCRVLGFTTQAFYAWRKSPVSQRGWDNAHLLNAAIDIHADDPGFGYRFIADELPARGISAGKIGSPGCARPSEFGHCMPKSAVATARPARRCTTTWYVANSALSGRTLCG